jgi:hypothetical protein
VRAIQSGTYGRIALAYIDWSSLPYSRLTLDWRIVGDKASADAFADALLAAPFYFGQGTAIGETLEIAAQMIETNTIQGTQRSIDISGDGPNNYGPPVHAVRDEVAAKRITINGLPVISTGEYGNGDWGIYYGKLEDYYVNCVIGGPRAFAFPAKGFQEFAEAVRRKLVLEISDASPANVIRIAAAPNASPPSRFRFLQARRKARPSRRAGRSIGCAQPSPPPTAVSPCRSGRAHKSMPEGSISRATSKTSPPSTTSSSST